MRRTNIYLDDAQTQALDDASKAEGVSRAELVRRFIESGLREEKSASGREQLIEAIKASFGVLGDEDVEIKPRVTDARSRHLERVRRL